MRHFVVTHESPENSFIVWINHLGLLRCFLLDASDSIAPHRSFLCHHYIRLVAHGIKFGEG